MFPFCYHFAVLILGKSLYRKVFVNVFEQNQDSKMVCTIFSHDQWFFKCSTRKIKSSVMSYWFVTNVLHRKLQILQINVHGASVID